MLVGFCLKVAILEEKNPKTTIVKAKQPTHINSWPGIKGELRDSGRVWEDPFPNSGCGLSPAAPDVPAAPVCVPASPSLSQPLGAGVLWVRFPEVSVSLRPDCGAISR